MSPAEIWWRSCSVAQRCADGVIAPLRESRRTFNHLIGDRAFQTAEPFFASPSAPSLRDDQEAELLKQADRVLAGRLSFFDLKDLSVGERINWNYDYSAKKQSPTTKASRIDYRDFDVAGDCKLVWEPNRHQHLVVLARAYAVSGKTEYAQAVLDQIDSWMTQCPFPTGMNWRSPLEFGVRIINWVWVGVDQTVRFVDAVALAVIGADDSPTPLVS
ncbi:MAG: heparinase II/III family protein [Phycisphaerae bacterium]